MSSCELWIVHEEVNTKEYFSVLDSDVVHASVQKTRTLRWCDVSCLKALSVWGQILELFFLTHARLGSKMTVIFSVVYWRNSLSQNRKGIIIQKVPNYTKLYLYFTTSFCNFHSLIYEYPTKYVELGQGYLSTHLAFN